MEDCRSALDFEEEDWIEGEPKLPFMDCARAMGETFDYLILN